MVNEIDESKIEKMKTDVGKKTATPGNAEKDDVKTQRALKRLQTTLVDTNPSESSAKRLRSMPKDEARPIIMRIVGGKCVGEAQPEPEEPKPERQSRDKARRSNQLEENPHSRSRSRSRNHKHQDPSSPRMTRARSRSRETGSRPARVLPIEEEKLAPVVAAKFCWICHKGDTQLDCGAESCLRNFHSKCATLENDLCIECIADMKAQTTSYHFGDPRELERLRPLLQYALIRMKNVDGSQHFCKPVSVKEHPKYREVVANPMDLETLESKLRNDYCYASTAAFYADAKWIVHNSIIYNSEKSPITAAARAMLKVCKNEIEDIEKCSDCYMNAHNFDDWFIQVCKKPHLLIWARLKGFPFWPAKVFAVNHKQQTVDARFFGAHDRAWVPLKDCFLLSKNAPPSSCKKRGDIDSAFMEMNSHIEMIKDKLGSFLFARDKTPFVPETADLQLQRMMPGWKPITPRKNLQSEKAKEAEKCEMAGSEDGIVADLAAICERENADVVVEEGEVLDSPKSDLESPAKQHECSISVTENQPTPNGAPAQPHAKENPKKNSAKQVITVIEPDESANVEEPLLSSESKSKLIAEKPAEDEIKGERKSIEEDDPNEETDSPPAVSQTRPVEIRRPMVKMVDIKGLGVKGGPSGGQHIVIAGPKPVKTLLVNPMAVKTSRPSPQDNAVTISTSSATTSKGPNHGLNIIAVDTKNSDAQRTLLKSLAGNEESAPRAHETAHTAKAVSDLGMDVSPPPTISSVPNGPILISQNGQAFIAGPAGSILTQNINGQINVVQLSQLQGNVNSNCVNLNNEGMHVARTSYPAVMAAPLLVGNSPSTSAASCAVVPSPKPSISVKKTLFDIVDPIESEVSRQMPKLTDTLHDTMVNILKSIGDNLPAVQNKILQMDMDNLKKHHKKQIDEMRIEMERNKKKLESEFQRKLADKQFELEKAHEDFKRILEQTKQKQWCALCRKEALFYCCWNTSYCNYPCQQQHWPTHMNNCTQISQASPQGQTPVQPRKKLIERSNLRLTSGSGGGPSFQPLAISEGPLHAAPSVSTTYNGPAARKKQ